MIFFLYFMIYRVMNSVKSVTMRKLVSQINLIQGKAKNLLEQPLWFKDGHFVKLFRKMATCPK